MTGDHSVGGGGGGGGGGVGRRESASQQVMGCNFNSDGEKSIMTYKNIQQGSNSPQLFFLFQALMTDIIENGNQRIFISGKILHVYPQETGQFMEPPWIRTLGVEFGHKPTDHVLVSCWSS